MKNYHKGIIYFLNRFAEISKIEKKLFFKGFVLCYVFAFLTKVLPLKYYSFLLQNYTKNPDIPKEERITRIKLVRSTLRRINRFNIFKFNCLTKAIVFKLLLNELGVNSNIVFCMNMVENRMFAHAYVRVNGRKVYLQKKDFVDVYSI